VASQAAPLRAWAYGSQRYQEVPYVPRAGYKLFSNKLALESLGEGVGQVASYIYLTGPGMNKEKLGEDKTAKDIDMNPFLM
jgi:hypothetical protein